MDKKLYGTWWCMVKRCHDPSFSKYKFYGARGIEVCERWRDYETFASDVGERPEGMTLDRIDNDGPYSPDNFRWATYTEQNRNKTINVNISHQGRTQCVAAWADELGIPRTTVYSRLKRGWSATKALRLEPVPPTSKRKPR